MLEMETEDAEGAPVEKLEAEETTQETGAAAAQEEPSLGEPSDDAAHQRAEEEGISIKEARIILAAEKEVAAK